MVVGRRHGRCFCQCLQGRPQRSDGLDCRLIVSIRGYKRPHPSPLYQLNPLHTKKRACTAAIMSFPHLPSQANSGHQQRTAQLPHAQAPAQASALAPASAPRSQSRVAVRVQCVLTMGQAADGQSDLYEHFAEVCTYEWTPISAAAVQKLGALNIPVKVVINEVPSGISSATGNEPKQRYVFKSSASILDIIGPYILS